MSARNPPADWDGWTFRHPLLPVLVVVTMLGALLIGLFWIPIGTPKLFAGRVLGVWVQNGRYRSSQYTLVALPDRRASIQTFSIRGCEVGSSIEVRGQRHVWGWKYSLDAAPCPAEARPGPSQVMTTP